MEAVNVPRVIQCEFRLLFLITLIILKVIKRKSFYTKKVDRPLVSNDYMSRSWSNVDSSPQMIASRLISSFWRRCLALVNCSLTVLKGY